MIAKNADADLLISEWFIDYDVATNNLRFFSSIEILGSNTDDLDTGYHHVVVTRDGVDDMVLYVDSISRDTANTGQDYTNGDIVEIGSRRTGTAAAGLSYVDEVGIWKGRALSQSDVDDLFNGGVGISHKSFLDVPPSVTLNLPINDSNITIPTVEFICNVSDDLNLTNVTLILDGVANETNSSGVNDTNYTFTKIINEGDHTWTCNASDNSSLTTQPGARDFNVNTTPFIEFITPTIANNTNLTDNAIPANINLTETLFDNLTIFLYNSTELNDSITFSNLTRFFNFTGLADGTYFLNATMFTNTSQTNSTVTREYTIDATPPVVNITSPTDIVNYQLVNSNLTLNWTALDANIDSCWHNYNGTNVTVTCNDNSTQLNITNSSNRNVTFYANDTFGQLSSDFQSWDYNIFENNQTFNNETAEGATEIFTINLTVGDQVSTANLIHNDTSFAGTLDNSNFPEVIVTKTLVMPEIDADVNVTVFWNITLNDGNTSESSSSNQTITSITLDDCSSNTTLILNYTYVDEETQTLINFTSLNSSIEVDVRLFSSDRTQLILNFSTEFNQIVPAQICINNETLNSTNYSMDVTTRYVADTYEPEFHHIQSFLLTNDVIPQDITLFGLLSTDSTTFLITFKDVDFLPEQDALININRNYVAEGVFKTVEIPLTDDNGQTTGHFDLDNVKYQIIVTKNRIILATFNDVTIQCVNLLTGDCKLSLNAFTTGIPITDFNTTFDLTYNIAFDGPANTISTTFATQGGGASMIEGNATLFDRFGNTSVCSSSLTSSTGLIICNIPESFENVTVVYDLFKDGELVSTTTYKIIPDASDRFGGQGPILTFIMVATFGLLLVSSSIGVIFGAWLGILIAGTLMLFNVSSMFGSGSVIVFMAISGGILIWKISRRIH